jgi:hypothetical protein
MIIELVISANGPTYYTQGWSNYYVTIQILIIVVQKFTQFLLGNYVGVYQYVEYLVPSCNAMCKYIYHHSYLHPHVHVYRHRNMCTIQKNNHECAIQTCAYPYICTWKHTCTHTHTHMYVHGCGHSHKHALAHGHTYTSIHNHMLVCSIASTCVGTCSYAQMSSYSVNLIKNWHYRLFFVYITLAIWNAEYCISEWLMVVSEAYRYCF